jgi:hypothetical protein
MPSRMNYIDAALDALATVMPNELPIRIVLREMLLVVCFGWIDDRDPTHADLRTLAAALEKAVAAA